MTVPFALQLAYGWTALALYTNLAAIFVAVPLLLAFTSRFGPTGAAVVWLLVNISYLLMYIPMTHRHLLKGEQRKWYLTDAGQPLVACATVGLLVCLLVPMPQDRLPIAFFLAITFGLLTVSASVAAPQVRTRFLRQISRSWMTLAPQR